MCISKIYHDLLLSKIGWVTTGAKALQKSFGLPWPGMNTWKHMLTTFISNSRLLGLTLLRLILVAENHPYGSIPICWRCLRDWITSFCFTHWIPRFGKLKIKKMNQNDYNAVYKWVKTGVIFWRDNPSHPNFSENLFTLECLSVLVSLFPLQTVY